jgi:ATP-dependent DNA helicase RecQ
VYRLKHERGQRFGAGQVIDILLGRSTAKVAEHRHDSLTVFGIGAELTESQWRGVVRQLLAQGLLTVQGDYGTLELTAGSDDVLGRRRQVMLRREPERPPRTRSARAAKTATVPDDLPPEAAPRFEKLRAWRGAAAKEQGVPAYVIFHDATLRQIAAQAPSSLTALSTVSGVGEAKLARYGQQVLDVLGGTEPLTTGP